MTTVYAYLILMPATLLLAFVEFGEFDPRRKPPQPPQCNVQHVSVCDTVKHGKYLLTID